MRSDRQNATNTVINAGTSAGVALSGPVALAIGGQWRLAFAAFAAVALVLALAAAISLPAARGGSPAARGLPPLTGAPQTGVLARLVTAAFLMGFASPALWSFGGQLATLRLGWDATGTGMLWIAIGVAGAAGAWAGTLVDRFGLDRVHLVFLGAMTLGILAVGSRLTTPATTIAGGALFGASYVMLTGAYLVGGVAALPERPATGLMIGFLTIAVGQTAGAPVFGLMIDHAGADFAVIAFAFVGIASGLARAPRKPLPEL